mgnify:CR=1 FL=1
MIRRIITIDESKCDGCGLCAGACHEGAIGIVEGKAKLLREHYCDGLGDCLPACPQGAISFEEREAPAYDEAAVLREKAENAGGAVLTRQKNRLTNWPVQIKLAPITAPFFQGAELLVAADCTAYAYANIHEDFIRGRTLLMGCTKLDGVDYAEKLGAILKNNDIRGVTVLRMQVPCCGGMEFAVSRAVEESGKAIPWNVAVISPDGRILQRREM